MQVLGAKLEAARKEKQRLVALGAYSQLPGLAALASVCAGFAFMCSTELRIPFAFPSARLAGVKGRGFASQSQHWVS